MAAAMFELSVPHKFVQFSPVPMLPWLCLACLFLARGNQPGKSSVTLAVDAHGALLRSEHRAADALRNQGRQYAKTLWLKKPLNKFLNKGRETLKKFEKAIHHVVHTASSIIKKFPLTCLGEHVKLKGKYDIVGKREQSKYTDCIFEGKPGTVLNLAGPMESTLVLSGHTKFLGDITIQGHRGFSFSLVSAEIIEVIGSLQFKSGETCLSASMLKQTVGSVLFEECRNALRVDDLNQTGGVMSFSGCGNMPGPAIYTEAKSFSLQGNVSFENCSASSGWLGSMVLAPNASETQAIWFGKALAAKTCSHTLPSKFML